MARIFKKWFMSPETEIFIYGMAGITITALEQSVMNADEYLQEVQNAPLPAGYFGPTAEQLVKTILSMAVLARSYTVYAYLFSYFAVLGVSFFGRGRHLLLPWLALSVLRHFVVDVAVALTGLFICLKYQLTPVCSEFILTRFIRIGAAAYMWRSVRLLFDELAAAAERARRSLANTYALSQEATHLLNRALLRLHMLPPEEQEAAATALGDALVTNTTAAAVATAAAPATVAAPAGVGAAPVVGAGSSGASVDVTGRPVRRRISEGITGAASTACAQVRAAPDSDTEDYLKLASRSLESLLTMLDYDAEAVAPLVARRREERRAGEGATPRQRALLFLRLTERDAAAARRRTIRALVGTSSLGAARAPCERPRGLRPACSAYPNDDVPEDTRPHSLHSLQSLHWKLRDMKRSSSSSSSGSGSPHPQVNTNNERWEVKQKTQSTPRIPMMIPTNDSDSSSSTSSAAGATFFGFRQPPPDITLDSSSGRVVNIPSSSRVTTSRESSPLPESADETSIDSKLDSAAAPRLKRKTSGQSEIITGDVQDRKDEKSGTSSETETKLLEPNAEENQTVRNTHECKGKICKRIIRQQMTPESTRGKESVRVDNAHPLRETSKERKRYINASKGRIEKGPISSSDSGKESSDSSPTEMSRKQFNRSSPYGASNSATIRDKVRKFSKSITSPSTDVGAMSRPTSSGRGTAHGGSKPSNIESSRPLGRDFKSEVLSVTGSMSPSGNLTKDAPFAKRPTRVRPNLKRADPKTVESKATEPKAIEPKTTGSRVANSKAHESKVSTSKFAVSRLLQAKSISTKDDEINTNAQSTPSSPSGVVQPLHTTVQPNAQSTVGSRMPVEGKVKIPSVDKKDAQDTQSTFRRTPSSRNSSKPGRNTGGNKNSDKIFAKKEGNTKHIDDTQCENLVPTAENTVNSIKTKLTVKTEVPAKVCPPNNTGSTNISHTTTFLKKKVSRKPANNTSESVTTEACLPSLQEDKVTNRVPAIKFLKVTSGSVPSRDTNQHGKEGNVYINTDVKKPGFRKASSTGTRRTEKQEHKIPTKTPSKPPMKKDDDSSTSSEDASDVKKSATRSPHNLCSKLDVATFGENTDGTIENVHSTAHFIRELLFEKVMNVVERTALAQKSRSDNAVLTDVLTPDVGVSVSRRDTITTDLNDPFEMKYSAVGDSIGSEFRTSKLPQFDSKNISQNEEKYEENDQINPNKNIQQIPSVDDSKSSIENQANESNGFVHDISINKRKFPKEEIILSGVGNLDVKPITKLTQDTELIENTSFVESHLRSLESPEVVSGVLGQADNQTSTADGDSVPNFMSQKFGEPREKDSIFHDNLSFAKTTSTEECATRLNENSTISKIRSSERIAYSNRPLAADSMPYTDCITYGNSAALHENMMSEVNGDEAACIVHSILTETVANVEKMCNEGINALHESINLERSTVSENYVSKKSLPFDTLHLTCQSEQSSNVGSVTAEVDVTHVIYPEVSDPLGSDNESSIRSESRITDEEHSVFRTFENMVNSEVSFKLNTELSKHLSDVEVSRDEMQFDGNRISSYNSPSHATPISCVDDNGCQYLSPLETMNENNSQDDEGFAFDRSLFREIVTAINNVCSSKTAEPTITISQKESKDDTVWKHLEGTCKGNVLYPRNISGLHSSYKNASSIAQLALREIVKSLDMCSNTRFDYFKQISHNPELADKEEHTLVFKDYVENSCGASDNLRKSEVCTLVYSVLKEIVSATNADICMNNALSFKILDHNPASTNNKSSTHDICTVINHVLNNVEASLCKEHSVTTPTTNSLCESAITEPNDFPVAADRENECNNVITKDSSDKSTASHVTEMEEASSIVQSVLTQVVAAAVKNVCASKITSQHKSPTSVKFSRSLGDSMDINCIRTAAGHSKQGSSIVNSIYNEIMPIICGNRSDSSLSPTINAPDESQPNMETSSLSPPICEVNIKLTAEVSESREEGKTHHLQEEEYSIFHSVLENIITAVGDVRSTHISTVNKQFVCEQNVSTVTSDDNCNNTFPQFDSHYASDDMEARNETDLRETTSVITPTLTEAVSAIVDAHVSKSVGTAILTHNEVSLGDGRKATSMTDASTTVPQPTRGSCFSLCDTETRNFHPSYEAMNVVQSILTEIVPTIVNLCSAKKSTPDIITSPLELAQFSENASTVSANICMGKALARDVAPVLYETVKLELSKSQEAAYIVDSILKQVEAAVENVVTAKPHYLNAMPSCPEFSSNSDAFFPTRNLSARRNAICSESVSFEGNVLHKSRTYESRIKEAECIVNSILNDAVSAVGNVSGLSETFIASDDFSQTKLQFRHENMLSANGEVAGRDYGGSLEDFAVNSIFNTQSHNEVDLSNTFGAQILAFSDKEKVSNHNDTQVDKEGNCVQDNKVVKTVCPDILSEIKNESSRTSVSDDKACSNSKEIPHHDALSKAEDTDLPSGYKNIIQFKNSSGKESPQSESLTRLGMQEEPSETMTPPSGYRTPDSAPAVSYLHFPPYITVVEPLPCATKHSSVVETDTTQSCVRLSARTHVANLPLSQHACPKETLDTEQLDMTDFKDGGGTCGGEENANMTEGEGPMSWPNSWPQMSSPWWNGQGAVPRGYFPTALPDTPWTDPQFYESQYAARRSESDASSPAGTAQDASAASSQESGDDVGEADSLGPGARAAAPPPPPHAQAPKPCTDGRSGTAHSQMK